MPADNVLAHLETARARMLAWPDAFAADERARLADPAIAETLDGLAYVDGWRRIQRTTPMILAAIARFDAAGDGDSARFWIAHLDEEHGHDRMMRDDLLRIYGSEAELERVLAANPITPPSAALVGYFEWQVAHGDPHVLIALRLLLEHIFATMGEDERARADLVVAGGSQTLALHHEADQMHVTVCADYVTRHFTDRDAARLIWSLDFAALMLSDAQVWIASRVLGSRD